MSVFKLASDAAQKRHQAEIEKAYLAKNVDKARIERRRNELYHERLARACLGISNSAEVSNTMYSAIAATPEILFTKMHYLGWGEARKQKNSNEISPTLLRSYVDAFSEELKISKLPTDTDIASSNITKSLICHGLSPMADTILLLADLGRSIRISYALGITEVEVLLADATWMKHNRSINQLFERSEFMDQLRVYQDKRARLYKALNINHRVFIVSDYDKTDNAIKEKALKNAADDYRKLAAAIWGESVLEKQNPETKRLIGRSFNGLGKRDIISLPAHIRALSKFDKFCKSFESSLADELAILRTISKLFGTFDEDIFIYYFAQYFAQLNYNNYIKIAPFSENGFDKPFEQNKEHFNAFINHEKSQTVKVNKKLVPSTI
ncbi:MAG: hypothetical protein OIF57_00800 [Marinobacterium sp.]|nr:hypothetical protein [Marinobacterium sp.]